MLSKANFTWRIWTEIQMPTEREQNCEEKKLLQWSDVSNLCASIALGRTSSRYCTMSNTRGYQWPDQGPIPKSQHSVAILWMPCVTHVYLERTYCKIENITLYPWFVHGSVGNSVCLETKWRLQPRLYSSIGETYKICSVGSIIHVYICDQ